jgi:hypothetical protein
VKVEGEEAQGAAVRLRSLGRPLQNSLKDLPHGPLVRPLFVLDERQEGQRAIAECVGACVRQCVEGHSVCVGASSATSRPACHNSAPKSRVQAGCASTTLASHGIRCQEEVPRGGASRKAKPRALYQIATPKP